MLNVIWCVQSKQNRHCSMFFFTWKNSKLTTSNLSQIVMLPRSKIHFILNNNVSHIHQTDVLTYEYSSHFHSLFCIKRPTFTATRMNYKNNRNIFVDIFICCTTVIIVLTKQLTSCRLHGTFERYKTFYVL